MDTKQAVADFLTNEMVIFLKENEEFVNSNVQDKLRIIIREMFTVIYEETKFASEAKEHAETDTQVIFNLLGLIDKGEL